MNRKAPRVEKYAHLVGQTIGRWRILSIEPGAVVTRAWVQCECGVSGSRVLHSIINGKSRGCVSCAGVVARIKARQEKARQIDRLAKHAP